MQMQTKKTQRAENEQIWELQAKKEQLQELIFKSQSLPLIISEKQQIVNTLRVSNIKINNEVVFRSKELYDMQTRLLEFERMESEVSRLGDREREKESQYEDYQQLKTKLDKQLRILQEEAQILKGKTIIAFNKINEVREEKSTQAKKKEVLEKHREQLRKGVDNLKKKIQTLKQQQKKKASNKHKIEQCDLEREINNLRLEIEYKNGELESKRRNQHKMLSEERYREIKEELDQLREQNKQIEENQKINEKLLTQKNQLEERIKFLEGVDIEFINQKKMLLSQLHQKYALFYAQMESSLQNLAKKEQQLAEYESKYPEGLIHLKKTGRKKRQHKIKNVKKVKEVVEQHVEKQVVEKPARFKGHKLKRLLLIMLGGFMVFGLVLNQNFGYSI